MPSQIDRSSQVSSNATTSSKSSSRFLTIIHGQTPNVLHMDNSIVDFHVISSSPHITSWFYFEINDVKFLNLSLFQDTPDPLAIAVLLENDLLLIDLKSEK